MEEKFYLDDFELSLKEHANQFKMVPSKKVWHGIYNDLHPGRRWPSVMVSMLLIISIVFVGYINTQTENNSGESTTQALMPSKEEKSTVAESNNKTGYSSSNQLEQGKNVTDGSRHNPTGTSGRRNATLLSQTAKGNLQIDRTGTATITNKNNTHVPGKFKSTIESESEANDLASLKTTDITYQHNYSLTAENAAVSRIINNENSGKEGIPQVIKNNIPAALLSSDFKISGIQNTHEKVENAVAVRPVKSIIENQVPTLGNSETENYLTGQDAVITATKRKRNEKISWVYYASPYVSSGSIKGTPLKENLNSNASFLTSLPQVTQKPKRVIRNATLGFEAGVQMKYSIISNLAFTAGLQITRSGYNIVSNLVHPTLSTLVLRDPSTGDIYSRNFVTHYGDGTGMSPVTLNNYSYQTSLPVGLQYMMWDNARFQINLGASIEPSFVIKANAYMLSSDGKNYVNVPDLLRKWNFSSNFAPFVSFRSDKFKWNIGPNIRYQWLSTYQKSYNVREHLIDYGIRIGISK